MNVLLDTHTWIWILTGEPKLSPKAVGAIEQAVDNETLFLSDITLWEVSMLAKKERITLGQPTLIWIKNALQESSLQLIPVTFSIVVA